MSKTFNLTLLPLYRIKGNEMPSPPGLLALTPPRRKARSRSRDLLFMHLVLGGNANFSTANYLQVISSAAKEFYNTPGSVTAALRAAAVTLNSDLLERNMEASGQGRFTLATLVLGVVRGGQVYLLISGPAHAYWMAGNERRDIHDSEMSGRGLGLGQSAKFYLSQLPLRTGGRLLVTPQLPAGWTPILQRDNQLASLETIRSVLMRQNMDDQNTVLIEFEAGKGEVTQLKPPPQSKPTLASISRKIADEPAEVEIEDTDIDDASHLPDALPHETLDKSRPATHPKTDAVAVQVSQEDEVEEIKSHQPEPQPITHVSAEDTRISETEADEMQAPSIHNESKIPHVRPALEAIAHENDEPTSNPEEDEILASIPRQDSDEISAQEEEIDIPEVEEEEVDTGPPVGEVIARQSARGIAKGMQATREGNDKLKGAISKAIPRILPVDDPDAPFRLPTWVMVVIAIIIPLVVVTIASVVYFRFGHDIQYETAYAEVEMERARALEESDPLAQRKAWESTIEKLDIAEIYDQTDATETIRAEAQNYLDSLLGIQRLSYQPAVEGIPAGTEIVAIAATDTDLFILNTKGEILRAYLVSGGYQYDENFDCKSGEHNGVTLSPLIDLQALPKSNAMGASVMGIDSQGNLLYCGANRPPQATSLSHSVGQFKEITAIALDADILYVLDAPAHEVWFYTGRNSAFLDYPDPFFENVPEGMELANAIDMSVNVGVDSSDLYLLFNNGDLASCNSNLRTAVPTRCTHPVELIDQHPAAGGGNSFDRILFTEIHLSTSPDSALLLLEPKTQTVYRFSPRSFTLLNQLHPLKGTVPVGTLSTIASNPSHILFIAQEDRIYQATDIR